MYKFRVILDTKDVVIREIALSRDYSLEDLHQTIVKAFGFEGMEMASFYHTDNEWTQGIEIPLINMNEQVGGLSQMSDYKLEFIFNKQNNKLIYVYDFLNLWTFFVEFIAEFNEIKDKSAPILIFSLGNLPTEPPKKEFDLPPIEDKDDFDELGYDDDSFYY